MLTKGAIGNLLNRYKAVLKKCHLINVFGSLAVVAILLAGSPVGALAMSIDEAKNYSTFGDDPNFPSNVGGTERLYFGGKLAEAGQNVSMEKSSLTLSSGTFAGEMDAGGMAYGAGAVSKVTDATINISGGKFTQWNSYPDADGSALIRGGGMADNGGRAEVENAVINITGGSFVNSTPDGDLSVMGGGHGEDEGISYTSHATINIEGFDSSSTKEHYLDVYGGGDEGSEVGEATINIKNSTLSTDASPSHVYGGGTAWEKGASSKVGSAKVNISGASNFEGGGIFGAGEAGDGGSVTVDTAEINIETTGTIDSWIQGGGYVGNISDDAQNSSTEVGTTNINIKNGTIRDTPIYGGSYNDSKSNGNNTANVGTTNINISGGTFEDTGVIGGNNLRTAGNTADVTTTNITITGGSFDSEDDPESKNVFTLYGGSEAFGGTANVDTANVTISGGTFAKKTFDGHQGINIYGGGYGAESSSGSAHTKNANVTISGVDLSGADVFGGGLGNASGEKATITMNNAQVHNLYGGGAYEKGQGTPSSNSVDNATINVSNTTANGIYGLNDTTVKNVEISVDGNSQVGEVVGAVWSQKETVMDSLKVTMKNGNIGHLWAGQSSGKTPSQSFKNVEYLLNGGKISEDVRADATEKATVTVDTNELDLGGKINGNAKSAVLAFTDKVQTFDGAKFQGFNTLNVQGETALTGGLTDTNVGTSLTLGGGGTLTADATLSSGHDLTLKGGTLKADHLNLTGGKVTVDQGGTLNTNSGQVFSTDLGGEDAKNEDPNALKSGITFNEGGNLALNDEYYNLAYANKAAELLGENVNLSMLGKFKQRAGCDNLVIGTNDEGKVLNAEVVQSVSVSTALGNINLGNGDTVLVNNSQEVTLLGDGSNVIESKQEVKLLVGSESGKGTVNLGSATQSGGGAIKGTATVAKDSTLNVQNGNFKITNVVLKSDASLNVNDTLSTDNLTAEAESVITVGNKDAAGLFSAKEVNLNGASLFLDPVWKDGGTIDDASQASLGGNKVNGLLTVGRNSLLTLGDTSSDWAKDLFANSGLTWGENAVSAALAIKTPQTLASVGGIKVDGSLTDDADTLTREAKSQDYASANTVEFASGSLLMTDAQKTADGALIGDGSSKLSVDEGSKLYLANAQGNQKYTVTKDFETTLKGWQDDNLVTNDLVNASVELEGKDVVVTTTSKDIRDTYPNIIPVNAMNSMALNTESDQMGVRFLSRAVDTASGYKPADPESTVNEVSRAAVTAGVQNTALRLSDAASDTVVQHLSLGNFDSGNATHQDGTDIWAAPLYGNTYTHGMNVAGNSVRGNYAGIAVGLDTQVGEIAGGKVRAGAAVHGGGGKSETKGTATSTENEYTFGGVNLYAGWTLDNLNVMASVGYGMGSHDVKMSLPSSMQMGQAKADVDTGALTADLRAEYQIKTPVADILPHAGVRYTSLHTDGHDVKVDGSKVNSVKSDTQNVVQFPVGVTVTKNIDVAGWKVKPQADVSVIPAAGEKKAFTKVGYSGIDATDSVNTRIMDSTSFGGMVGVQMEKGNFALGLNYGVQASKHETDQGVKIGLSWKF